MITPFPEISTKRISLKQITISDINNIYIGLSDPIVYKYYGVRYLTIEATNEQINFYENLEKTKTGIWWAMYLNSDMDFIGAIGFNNYQPNHNKIELGFWLLPKYWGNGYVIEAAEEVCNFAFSEIKVHRIEALVENENENSKRTLRKLGFRHEGTMIDSEIKDGRYISLDIFSKFNK